VFSGYFDVLRALADLRDRGVECHLVCGNHDFWAGRFFRNQLGFEVHTESYECTIGNRRARFVHGDGVNPCDRWYNFYKRIARSRIAIAMMWVIHPDLAMAIARRLSHASRSLQAPAIGLRSAEIAATRAYARDVIASGAADIVVCGHTHTAAHEEFDGPRGRGIYINTGGWVDERVYWVWDGESFSAYNGRVSERRRAHVGLPNEGQNETLGAIDIARQKADKA
jgi:UDP-2,3-diacylglucosamine hydrolase